MRAEPEVRIHSPPGRSLRTRGPQSPSRAGDNPDPRTPPRRLQR
jgi:hypothetical protein